MWLHSTVCVGPRLKDRLSHDEAQIATMLQRMRDNRSKPASHLCKKVKISMCTHAYKFESFLVRNSDIGFSHDFTFSSRKALKSADFAALAHRSVVQYSLL